MEFKDLIKKILTFIPLKIRLKIIGYLKLGYILNLEEPKTFNEKINYRKINWKDSLFSILSNKYTVRDYVSKTIGENYLIPIVYFGERLSKDDLNLESGDYVVKTTHDSGVVFFINESTNENEKNKIIKNIGKSLKRDYGYLNDESWYSKSKPGVIIEKMLLDDNGKPPKDYKFHIFNNKKNSKVLIQVDFDRFCEHTRNFYDERGELVDIECVYKKNENYARISDEKLNEMISVAKKLAEPFDYVRVDLYSANGSVFFGEMTFAHERGFGKFMPKSVDKDLGGFWCVSNE